MLPKEHEVLGRITMSEKSNDETGEKSSSSDKSCVIYRLSSAPGVIMCICNLDVRPEQSFSWTEQVSEICYCRGIAGTSGSISYSLLESVVRPDIHPKSSRSHEVELSGLWVDSRPDWTFQQVVTNLSHKYFKKRTKTSHKMLK